MVTAHQAVVYLKSEKKKSEIVLKGVLRKGILRFEPSIGLWLNSFVPYLFALNDSLYRVKVDSLLRGSAARELKKN